MSDFPEELKYAETHEWVRQEAENIISVGITDFAQSELGDLVFFDMPEVGRVLVAKEQCAVVESVKTASDLFSPVAGEVIAVNEILEDEPELVNEDAYNTWLFRIKVTNDSGLKSLLNAQAYAELIEE
ncbi:MAG: glycine cleavage system protein GcvH [Methyloprofundus sp.]|nr:glycine cleavage system protein GcvH [Methyloprofundus sp.]